MSLFRVHGRTLAYTHVRVRTPMKNRQMVQLHQWGRFFDNIMNGFFSPHSPCLNFECTFGPPLSPQCGRLLTQVMIVQVCSSDSIRRLLAVVSVFTVCEEKSFIRRLHSISVKRVGLLLLLPQGGIKIVSQLPLTYNFPTIICNNSDYFMSCPAQVQVRPAIHSP